MKFETSIGKPNWQISKNKQLFAYRGLEVIRAR